jgi:hypothetical protein
MKMKVLVTGGAGALGQFPVRKVVRDGHVVRIMSQTRRGPSDGMTQMMPALMSGFLFICSSATPTLYKKRLTPELTRADEQPSSRTEKARMKNILLRRRFQ